MSKSRSYEIRKRLNNKAHNRFFNSRTRMLQSNLMNDVTDLDDTILIIDECKNTDNDSDTLDIVLFDDIPDSMQNSLLIDNVKPELLQNRDLTRKSSEQDLAEIFLLDDLDTNEQHIYKTTSNSLPKRQQVEIDLEDEVDEFKQELDSVLDRIVFDKKLTKKPLALRAYTIKSVETIGIEGKAPQSYIATIEFSRDRNASPKLDYSAKEELQRVLDKWSKVLDMGVVEFNIIIKN